MDGDGWMWGHGGGWAGWLAMWVVMLLVWAALIAAAVIGVRYLGGAGRPATPRAPSPPPDPERVLAQRYARGDIDDDEFRRRVATLREHRAGAM